MLVAERKTLPRCTSCKARHRGCDKKRPICSTCSRSGTKCTYPPTTGTEDTNVSPETANELKPGKKESSESTIVSYSEKHAHSESLDNESNDRASKRPRAASSTSDEREATRSFISSHPTSPFMIQDLKGTLPFLNSHFTHSVMIDPVSMGTTIYIFGGLGKHGKASSDFYKLDMNSREWTDLTSTVIQLNNPSAHNPFDSVQATPLPPRADATSQIYETEGGSFLLIFGGSEDSPESPNCSISTNTLITVNLNESKLTWEFVSTTVDETSEDNQTKPPATEVTPRSAAGLFIQDKKLFVFGGYRKFIEVEGRNENDWVWDTVDSFSVLDLVSLKWIVCDRPYPLHVGSLGYAPGIYVPPCFGGNKVLICRSKLDDDKSINLTSSDMFLFNTKSFTFGSLSHQVVGQFPSSLALYDVSPHRGPVSKSTFLLFGDLCDKKYNAEIWSFDMLTDSWKNLELSEELEKLQVQSRFFEHIPGKGWCLFGYQKPKMAKHAITDATRQNIKQEPHTKARKTWNVCVRIKLDDE